MRRLEMLAELALHAFPILHCSNKFAHADTPMGSLHEIYRIHLREKLAGMPFWSRNLVIAIWPALIPGLAFYMVARNGLYSSRRHGRGIVGQFVDQIRLAVERGTPPLFYYCYALHERSNAVRAQEYLHHWHIKNNALYVRLYADRAEQRRRAAMLLNDKLAFHQFANERGLPTAYVHATVSDGVFSWSKADRAGLPKKDVFIKPRRTKGGRGAERWTYSNGFFSDPHGRLLDRQELADHIAALSRTRPFLVLDCLTNHPDLGNLTAGALSTLRMYTFRNEGGNIEHIFTMFRMSRDPVRVVDNIHAGGIGAAVEPETGVLGRAIDFDMFGRTEWLDRHPVTGAQIEGRKLPYWKETLDLVLSAHRQMNDPILVGWDVGLTRDGPVLVEGNKAPAIELEQRLDGPWGNKRFGQLLAHHLKNTDSSGAPSGCTKQGLP